MARKMSIRKGDTVLVISGKDAGKKGKVLRALPAEERVVVEGVNIVKRHQRPRPGVVQSGIIEKEAPIHRSNVMLVCPRCGRPTRVAKKQLDDGRRVRACKKCGEVIDR
ncbi:MULTISPECIES: 50S ribosomal protein L24 [Thermaerobacter]|uniref:Large ribosomal subunit protein uL24 n=1 Tax=Thermaerobacter composti TaxID=554949 RepID=A0ABZ0QNF8_9FIRM|nr:MULTISPECIES: 50S ribosomal protein L24 [Thermaerobacter]PZN09408.1 MAG: 50S ribosomal protein L24 [Bacillota bacterium]QBS37021.1 50S ribosomal protein L24 [Thermaerobacter sp. FW80]WPD19032.1 50S ribosomal protein L24 [Thermaerobacter composti]